MKLDRSEGPALDWLRLLWLTFAGMVLSGSVVRWVLLFLVGLDLLQASDAELSRAFWIGMRLDAVTAAYLTFPMVALLTLPRAPRGARPWSARFARSYAAAIFTATLAAGLADIAFFRFYGYRMNFLVLDHGGDPEVIRAALRTPYVLESVVALGGIGATLLLLRPLLARLVYAAPRPRARELLLRLASVALIATFARGTLDHRPLNPTAASISRHRTLNEIAGSGLYSVAYEAIRRARGEEIMLASVAGRLTQAEARARVARLTRSSAEASPPRRSKPMNVVVVVMESFTGRLVGAMGGTPGLSPEFDRLADEGLFLTRCYATGERTVQGLEAVVASYPPLPGVSIMRRPEAQGTVETLGSVAARQGYETLFLYGGQAIFDHMRGFFLGNGFQRVIEERDFVEPEFRGSWGVSDEDLFDRANQEFQARHAAGRAFVAVVLTVSLHSPWEHPSGRVGHLGPETPVPDGFEREELESFTYADYAIGKFIRDARKLPYFDDTLFVFVADHGVHLRSQELVPSEEYRVPALFLAPDFIRPERVDSVTSQIDIAPTILSILGLHSATSFFGRDLLAPAPTDALAVLVYRKERYAVRRGRRLTVLGVGSVAGAYRLDPTGLPVETLVRGANVEDARDGLALLQLAEERLDAGSRASMAMFRSTTRVGR